jgi:DNA-directed RNA polymerase specialized sigma24 family protein
MKPEPFENTDRSENRSDAAFRSTRWSVVLSLKDGDPDVAWNALEELCRIYWPPLYAFARRKGIPRHDAEDLVQGFFQQLTAREGFREYSPKEGARFRTWLLSCLKCFNIDEWRKKCAEKRGGTVAPVSLDLENEHGRAAFEVPGSDSPEAAFDAALARRLCQQVFKKLELEQAKSGNAELYTELKRQLLSHNSGGETQIDATLGAKYGMSGQNIAKRRERLRKRFGEILRTEIAELVSDENDIDDELRYLLRALG